MESVDSAQVATATLYKEWLDINSEAISVQKGPSNVFLLDRLQKLRLEYITRQEAFKKYYQQGEPRKGDH